MTTQLTTQDVADLAGVDPASIRRYRLRGAVPDPDGHTGRTPWWYPKTVGVWLRTRPKKGWQNK